MLARIAALVLLPAIMAAAASAFAQSYSPPRTPDGRPDLQGVWVNQWITPLERQPGTAALEIPASEAATWRERFLQRLEATDPLGPTEAFNALGMLVVDGAYRTSLMIEPADGRLPYTDEGRLRRSQFLPNGARQSDDPEQRASNERCLLGGGGFTPFMPAPAGNIRQIVQTSNSIVIWTELFSALRIIPVDGRPSAIGDPSGSSKARWEGNTLVVETTGFRPEDGYRSVPLSVMVITPETRITERFVRTSADEIRYSFTVEDGLVYTRPWTAETVLKKTSKPLYEFACHEGNYGLANILRGARMAEQRMAAKAKQ